MISTVFDIMEEIKDQSDERQYVDWTVKMGINSS